MPTETVEERLTALEQKMERLLDEKAQEPRQIPWWEKIYGSFAGSEDYDEAMRLGREYRQSQRLPEDDENGKEDA